MGICVEIYFYTWTLLQRNIIKSQKAGLKNKIIFFVNNTAEDLHAQEYCCSFRVYFEFPGLETEQIKPGQPAVRQTQGWLAFDLLVSILASCPDLSKRDSLVFYKNTVSGCWVINYLSCCSPSYSPSVPHSSAAEGMNGKFAGTTPPANPAPCDLHILKPPCILI